MNLFFANIGPSNSIINSNFDDNTLLKVAQRITQESRSEGVIEFRKNKYKFVKTPGFLSFFNLSDIHELENLAWIDQLTGTYNRHSYWKILKEVFYESVRLGNNLGLIFVDIDNLKKINSEKGYLGGDKAIKGIGQIIQKRVRKYDHVFRIGGDEFVVLTMFKKGQKQAFKALVKRIYLSIQNKSKVFSTASLGAALITNKRLTTLEKSKSFKKEWEQVFNHVDQLAASVKKSTKNSYVIEVLR